MGYDLGCCMIGWEIICTQDLTHDHVYTIFQEKKNMEQGQIIGLKEKIKKNNDHALEFIQKLESSLNEFEKSGDFSNTYSDIKKSVLEYKNKLVNQL